MHWRPFCFTPVDMGQLAGEVTYAVIPKSKLSSCRS